MSVAMAAHMSYPFSPALPADSTTGVAAQPHTDLLHDTLFRVFGISQFRPLQQEIILDALAGRDVLAVLPTGAGKSLCFQLPALLRPGLVLVVSPLVALMKDQVDSLLARGVSATFLSSELDPLDYAARMLRVRQGETRLLYVAPERLLLPGFLTSLGALPVRHIAVDEAHCISRWGHDFRPEYRRIADLRRLFPAAPILAVTATANARVRDDIASCLRLVRPARYVASFDRPNLVYRVCEKEKGHDPLADIARRHAGAQGIVYARSRLATEKLAEQLRGMGIRAAAYHAGLPADERLRVHEAFLRGDVHVVTATIAFGMGIHKADVRFVVHHEIPPDIESYYQETGRAGRDGLPGECLLIFRPGDVVKQRRRIDLLEDPGKRALARAQLLSVVAFARTEACRRELLLRHFGEASSQVPCGGCDNCLALASPAPPPEAPVSPERLIPPSAPANDTTPDPLFEALRHLRKRIAKSKSVPSYVVFPDAALNEMVLRKPMSLPDLAAIRGIGPRRLAAYGPELLEVLVAPASRIPPVVPEQKMNKEETKA